MREGVMETNWAVLEVEGVEDIIEQAVTKVCRQFDFMEHADLKQEARIIVGTNAATVQTYLDKDNLGGLHHWLWCDLVDLARVAKDRQDRQVSFEQRYTSSDDGEEYAPRPVSIAIRNDTKLYTRELVEVLLPAVWDESYCYGLRMENAPDSDMPRGSVNKATGNTLAAHIADIKTGWEKAPLTVEERRALFLGYVMGWKQKEIAFNQGVSQKTISLRLSNGVGKIAATLNGVDLLDWYTEEAA